MTFPGRAAERAIPRSHCGSRSPKTNVKRVWKRMKAGRVSGVVQNPAACGGHSRGSHRHSCGLRGHPCCSHACSLSIATARSAMTPLRMTSRPACGHVLRATACRARVRMTITFRGWRENPPVISTAQSSPSPDHMQKLTLCVWFRI